MAITFHLNIPTRFWISDLWTTYHLITVLFYNFVQRPRQHLNVKYYRFKPPYLIVLLVLDL